MKFLVIGLGSMGKRRVRCLKALGHTEIIGFDPREDRRLEAMEKYQIQTSGDWKELSAQTFQAALISTPPDTHDQYMDWALEKKIPCFVEASVIVDQLPKLKERADSLKVVVAPSCTLMFHPAIKQIKELVDSGKYGKVTNFTYHSGQYLPDWHPWEKVTDYYVSKPATGGCREIVPFEMTWLAKVFGFPQEVKGFVAKTMDVGAPIHDTYSMVLNYGKFVGMLTVDVVSRTAVRQMILNFEKGQVLWNWDKPSVEVYSVGDQKWTSIELKQGKSEAGYNKNIAEDMYIDEVAAFLNAAAGKASFPTDLGYDIQVLNVLNQVEKNAGVSIG